MASAAAEMITRAPIIHLIRFPHENLLVAEDSDFMTVSPEFLKVSRGEVLQQSSGIVSGTT